MSSPASSGSNLSLSFDRQEALAVFKNVSDHSLLLALISWITPQADWQGCEITEGTGTPEKEHLIHVGIRGPAAGQIREHLLSVLSRVELTKVEQGAGDLLEEKVLVRADGDRWKAP